MCLCGLWAYMYVYVCVREKFIFKPGKIMSSYIKSSWWRRPLVPVMICHLDNNANTVKWVVMCNNRKLDPNSWLIYLCNESVKNCFSKKLSLKENCFWCCVVMLDVYTWLWQKWERSSKRGIFEPAELGGKMACGTTAIKRDLLNIKDWKVSKLLCKKTSLQSVLLSIFDPSDKLRTGPM